VAWIWGEQPRPQMDLRGVIWCIYYVPSFQRCDGTGEGVETPIGVLPKTGSESGGLDVNGLNMSDNAIQQLLHVCCHVNQLISSCCMQVDTAGWRKEVEGAEKYFSMFGKHMPAV